MAFLQAVAGLAVVLGAIAASAWLMKRLVRVHASHGSPMSLRGTLSVGPRERVMLVEVADTWIVLGVAPGRVSALHALPRGALAPVAETPAATAQAPFAALLKRVMPHAPR